MPLLIAPRVNNSPRTKPRFAISSVAKDEAKGTSVVIATDWGFIPAAKGDPKRRQQRRQGPGARVDRVGRDIVAQRVRHVGELARGVHGH